MGAVQGETECKSSLWNKTLQVMVRNNRVLFFQYVGINLTLYVPSHDKHSIYQLIILARLKINK